MNLLLIVFSVVPFSHQMLLELFAHNFQFTHNICLSKITPGETSEITAALICSDGIHSSILKDILARASLFHVVVVSKSHLVFLGQSCEVLLRKFPRTGIQICIFLLLTLAILASSFQAPLVRSLLTILATLLSRKLRWNWDPEYILIVSILLCLVLNPQWLDSLSLLHSCGCATAMLLATRCFPKQLGSQILLCFMLTVPFLWGWGNIHPLTVIYGALLSPVIFALWMPCSYLAFFVPAFIPTWSRIFTISLDVVTALSDPIPEPSTSPHIPVLILWTVILGTLILLRLKRQVTRA